ncbi:S41 family peptidase [Gelidibacter japonicus]|uniref:S41 family peptidase n=1 Tax=Gelidibacter japonicus TaxID=1962232 RepID=UPI002020A6CD|nr:S41 family peptidase [Gelidibacter japonicus]MCL8009286.1 S41 family peptidase [Gelidibacter japonicus]
MKHTTLIILAVISMSCLSQTEKKYNLDFETYNPRYLFAKDWMEWGDHSLTVDTLTVHSGNYSGKIKSRDKGTYGVIAYEIPANYTGDSITLEGYMKIRNVENGYAGLLLRIDGNNTPLAGENMENRNINGTKDWQKLSITLAYPKEAETIIAAGIMTGTGEAWFDDFVLTIDGQDIQTLKEKEKPIYKAALDKEFDLGSKIEVSNLNDALITNLELLGKVWGFLKYNHPEIGKGNYNWDFELFRMLPEYMSSKNTNERDQLLLKWISKYGAIETCTTCQEASKDAVLIPDLSWLNEFGLNTELKNKLQEIYQNRFQGHHYYIGKAYTGNAEFLNEDEYYTMAFEDDGFKLLALYRYWNMIHYFFPYKHLTDKDWNRVLKEYIPIFVNAKNKLDYELACIRLIGEINDTHGFTYVGFNNVQNRRGMFYPPLKVDFIEGQLVVTDYYNPELKTVAQLKIGDVITAIDHKPIQAIIDSVSAYYPASNRATKLRNISRDILRSNNKDISVDYISNHQKHQHRLPLYKQEDLNMRWYRWTTDKSYKFIAPDIGYVSLEFIKKEDIPEIKEIFKDTKGIIIDIRNYPSVFVPFSLGSYFVSSITPFVKFSNFNGDHVGEFTFTPPLEIPKGDITYNGKLVVLVNETTQSQAEYTTMAFRAGANTTVVGSTTAGADGDVSSIYLPGGLLTNISGIGVYYPDGTETQRVGIVPDVEIKPTREGIKQGRDELLEKAIELINQEPRRKPTGGNE